MSAANKSGWTKWLLLLIVLVIGVAAGLALQKYIIAPKPASTEAKEDPGKTLYTCPMHPEVIQDHPGDCPICGMHLVPMDKPAPEAGTTAKGPDKDRKILYWVAPMDPTFRSDKPGKSPMGMDLVPVYEEGPKPSGNEIMIDPAVVQTIGVRTDEVARGPMSRVVTATGTFEVDEESLVTVNTKVEGYIERLYVNKEGQAVKKGAPLLAIYSPDLVSTQEEYLSAVRNLAAVGDSPFPEVVQSARSLVDATEQRLRLWDISSAQIKRLASTGKVMKDLTLYAPASGVVMERKAAKGMKVMPGEELVTIADLSKLWLMTKFYEQDSPWVFEGDSAEIALNYLPGKKFSGRVSYIYPYMDRKTRYLTARIVVPNPDGLLMPGMYATVTIRHTLGAFVVMVPDEAVIQSGERNVAFVDLGNGRFEPREVELGVYGDGHVVEIRSGLKAGERVVVSAQFLLDSESRLQEAIKKTLEAGKAAGGGHEH